MTYKEVQKLSSDDKRIAIAKACGWENRGKENGCYLDQIYLNGVHQFQCSCWWGQHVLDYLNDLNVIQAAILQQKWTASQERYFQNDLWKVFACQSGGFRDGAQVTCNATAEQKADAFLMTI